MTETTPILLNIVKDGGVACAVMLTLVVGLVILWRFVLHPAMLVLQNIFSTLERTTQNVRVSTENLQEVTARFEPEKKPKT